MKLNAQWSLVYLLWIILVCSSACTLDTRISTLESKSFEKSPEGNFPGDEPSTPPGPIVSKPSGNPYFNSHVGSLQYDSFGRAIYVGAFSAFTFDRSHHVARIMRLNTNGSLDTTFDTGVGLAAPAARIGMTAANDIILSGGFYSYSGASVPNIFKIGPLGQRVTAYNPGVYASVFEFVQTPAEKIIAVGNFYYWDTFATSQESIVRINADGTRDTSLTIGSSFNPVRTAYALGLQSDGKIVIGGDFNSYNGSTSPKLIRLNSNGTYDSTLAVGTGFNGTVYDLTILSDGSIIVVGNFTSYKGTTGVNRIAKLSSTGTLDMAFVTAIGSGFTTAVTKVKEIPGMGLIVGGLFTTFQGSPAGGLICLNTNGTRCSGVNFGAGIAGGGANVSDFVKLDANTLIVVGDFKTFDSVAKNNLVTLNLDGSIANSLPDFKGVEASSNISAVYVQPDGKIILSGEFMIYDPTETGGLVRFNEDKTLDEDFLQNVQNLPVSIASQKVLIDPSDRLWVAGSITSTGGYNAANILRLSSDGSLDTACTNSLGSGFNGMTSWIFAQPDGKIFVSGYFTTFSGNMISGAARIATNCTSDSSYSTGTGVTGTIVKSFLLSTGKILHFGSTLTGYSGTTVSKVIRVNSNGTLDGTYPNNSSKTGWIYDVFMDTSDRLYVLAPGSTYNGTATNALSRILPDGTVDPSFSIGAGFDVIPNVVKFFGNKIYVGGNFTTYQGGAAKYFVILNDDGTEDTTIQRPEALFPVSDIAISPDGKIEFGYEIIEIQY